MTAGATPDRSTDGGLRALRRRLARRTEEVDPFPAQALTERRDERVPPLDRGRGHRGGDGAEPHESDREETASHGWSARRQNKKRRMFTLIINPTAIIIVVSDDPP